MASAEISTAGIAHGGNLSAGLAPFRRRAVRLMSLRTLLVGVLVALAVLVGCMWLDLIWAIPMEGRWVITRLGAVAAVIAIAAACWRRTRGATPDRLALEIDTRAKTGGEVLAGWQLEDRPPAKCSPLTLGMARMASNRAGQRLSQIAPESVLPAEPVKRALWLLCGGLILLSVLITLMPGVAWNQWQRFAFPSRDIPPFTGVVITLDPSSATVRYGDELTIRAKVVTGRAERMQLVTVTPDGVEHTLPMLPQQNDQWQAVLTRVTRPVEYFARSGRSRSQAGKLDVQMTPEIVSAKVRITPPAYTRRAIYDGVIPKDGISGLAGTNVEFLITSNRPLRAGRMELAYRDGTQAQVALAPAAADATTSLSDSSAVRGAFSLEKAGRFDIWVVDTDGIESTEHVAGSITITTDQRPVVRIIEPRPLSLATPDVRLPIVVAADDDYGVTSLQLFRSLNGSAAMPMKLPADGRARQNATFDLPLAKYGLEPGDELQFFARVEDNDPAGAKGAESPVTIVRIISKAQFQEMIVQQQGAESLQSKYRATQRYLERLADTLRQVDEAADAADKAAPEGPAADEAMQQLQDKLTDAKQAAAEAAEKIDELSENPLPIDVDMELVKRLAELSQRTGMAAEKLGEIAEAQKGERKLSDEEKLELRQMASRLGKEREDLQNQALQPLEKLQKAMPLIADQQAFIQLAEAQRDLARRLDSLRAAPAADQQQLQRRVAELEVEQQMLRETAEKLLRDIDAHAEALGDEAEFADLKKTAREFTAAVRESEALGRMGDAQYHLLGKRFGDATEAAQNAAEALESFIKKCDEMGQAGNGVCNLAFNPQIGAPGLGNTIQQLLQMLGQRGNGNGQGMGFGTGAGGGYSTRSNGPQNIGMYGSLPMNQQSQSRGRGDRTSQGVATNSRGAAQQEGRADESERRDPTASGQSGTQVPAQYRAQVSEYFRRLTEMTGEEK